MTIVIIGIKSKHRLYYQTWYIYIQSIAGNGDAYIGSMYNHYRYKIKTSIILSNLIHLYSVYCRQWWCLYRKYVWSHQYGRNNIIIILARTYTIVNCLYWSKNIFSIPTYKYLYVMCVFWNLLVLFGVK